MSMTEQELSDEISAVIEARMSVPWQDAEPAAKALATMVKQYIERHIAAGDYSTCCDTPAYCSSVRRCTAKDAKPAGAVPLPEVAATVCLTPDGYAHGHMLDLQVQVKPMETFAIGDRLCRYEDAIRYGDAREAAARGAVPANWNEDSSLETWFPYTAEPLKALEAENEKLRATGRADAVPAWFGELPAPISNPEAWPANYAGGYNDALNMCYDVIRGHAPQQMTTQGEAAIRAIISDLRNYGTPELPKRWERISSLRLTDIVADELEAAITGPQP